MGATMGIKSFPQGGPWTPQCCEDLSLSTEKGEQQRKGK